MYIKWLHKQNLVGITHKGCYAIKPNQPINQVTSVSYKNSKQWAMIWYYDYQ